MPGFDAVVIGAGHNGLTCACYLARAGLKVIVLEEYHDVGGMTITEEIAGAGFHSDIHASGFLVAKLSPVLAELGLEENGLELITPEPNWAHVRSDGRFFLVGRDPATTAEQLARYSRKDAETWSALYERWLDAKPKIVTGMYSPPPSLSSEIEAVANRPGGLADYRFSLQSVRSWVDETFESHDVRAFVASFALHAGLSPDEVGGAEFAWLFLATIQDVGCSTVRGGMQHVSRALASVLREEGCEVRTGARVERIVVQGGKATAVRLAGGEEIGVGEIVASSIDPRHLVLDLLGEEVAGPTIADKIRRYEWGDSFFTVYVALDSPVEFAAVPGASGASYSHAAAPSLADLALMFDQCRGGKLPASPMLGLVNESAVDHTRAPEGRGLLKLVAHFVPYRLTGDGTGTGIPVGSWDEARDRYADYLLERLDEQFMPGLRGRMLRRVAQSPLDLERRITSAVQGTHQHGALLPYQSGSLRPIPELGNYRAPVDNVYLCGAGSHPGSGVSMGPGRNAAAVICSDLGLAGPGAAARQGTLSE
jgi:beta-carotene ketolase (CrtO type)